nr:ABC transporter ATP-binding protein [Pseudaestuariivita rosea]
MTGGIELFKWLWHSYLKKYKWWLGVAIILMSIEGAMMGVFVLLIQSMIDQGLQGDEPTLLWIIAAAILATFSIRAITGILNKLLMTYIVERTTLKVQRNLTRHLMTLDTLFHQSHSPGYLIERVQGDVRSVNTVWRQLVYIVGRDITTLVSLFAVAIFLDPIWTLVALVAVPLAAIPTVILQRFIKSATRDSREIAGQMSTRLDEVFHGINPIKLNALEDYQYDRYFGLLRNRMRAERKSVLGKALLPAMIDIITAIGLIVVLFYGANEIRTGQKTIGSFIAFFFAMSQAFDPIRRLANLSGIWAAASVNLERLKELFDLEPTLVSPAQPKALPTKDTSIDLQGVHFAYGDLPVLNGLSFRAEAGKTTALVGASGAGKSTVFNLLTRLIDPVSGTISIGGTNVADIKLEELRGQFSVVTQDALLFDDSIRENILLGRKDVSDGQLQNILDAAHVSEFVKTLPDGLDTPAGTRGSGLSGGQRQRVAIARALLRDTPILLLDEATSALDTQSEALVQEALERLSQGRTTLVIAHRLSTVRDADKIVVMRQGQAVEEGQHDDLLAQNGLYADLYNMQFREED